MDQPGQPSRRRPERLPLDVRERTARELGREPVIVLVERGHHAIERVRHAIRIMAGEVLREGRAVELAPASAGLLGQSLGLLEHVVRHGDRGLHTMSITAP